MLASQLAHQSTLADGWKTDEATAFAVSQSPAFLNSLLYRRRVLTYTLATPVRATSKPAIKNEIRGYPEIQRGSILGSTHHHRHHHLQTGSTALA